LVALGEIARVLVERRRRERLLGVGRILVFLQDQRLEPLVLEGVRDPEHIALRIRHQVQKVREE
jgi:hypothetical protein